MRVHVLFFGSLREIVGCAEEDAEVSEGASLHDLFAKYNERYPALGGFRGSVVGSINQAFADWQARLTAGDEVAFLPPVSGGTGEAFVLTEPDIIVLVRAPIHVAEIVDRLKAQKDGAVVAFEGI